MKLLAWGGGGFGMASPPARGAWIEINHRLWLLHYHISRPPHGGRGLKFDALPENMTVRKVAPRTGGVD